MSRTLDLITGSKISLVDVDIVRRETPVLLVTSVPFKSGVGVLVTKGLRSPRGLTLRPRSFGLDPRPVVRGLLDRRTDALEGRCEVR